jgi:hypothetical protein
MHLLTAKPLSLSPVPTTLPSPSAAQGDPVLLSGQPADRVDLYLLARSKDENFNKIMVTLTALCEEVSFLKRTAEAKFYAQLSLFGHSKHDDAEEWSDGLLEAQVGISLPLLQDASNFVARVHAVVYALVRQAHALFSREAGFLAGFKEVKLSPLVCALGDALRVLLTLDAILRSNKALQPAWDKYKRLADIMRSDPAKYGADASRAGDFDALLKELDGSLIAGCTFQRCIDQRFESSKEAAGSGLATYKEWLRASCLEQLDGALAGIGNESETTEAQQAVGQFAVYALFRVLATGRVPQEALQKEFARLWKAQEKVPLVPLWGGKAIFLADEFLAQHAGVAGLQPSKLVPREPRALRAATADALEAALPSIANVVAARTAAWLVRARMAFSATPIVGRTPPGDILRSRALLVTQAVCLAFLAGRTLNTFVASTLFLGRSIKRRSVAPLARLAELSKVLEGALRSYSAPISESLPHSVRETGAALVELCAPLRLKAGAAKSKLLGDDPARFIEAATVVISDLVTSTESWGMSRRILLELCLSTVTQKSGICKPAEIEAVGRTTWSLGILADHAALTAKACDTSVLYWVRELMPGMVAATATTSGEAPLDHDCRHGERLAFLFAALSDPAKMLARVVHLPPAPEPAKRLVGDALLVSGGSGADAAAGGSSSSSSSESGSGSSAAAAPGSSTDKGLSGVEHVLTSYERYLHGILHADIIMPLCRAVEADLRVHVHAVHLAHMEPPLLRGHGRPPLVHLLACGPFRVVSALVDIKAEVTHYLEKTFYELTTIALHDWKT